MSTKKPAVCLIPAGRKPTKAQYEKVRRDFHKARERVKGNKTLSRLLAMLVIPQKLRGPIVIPEILEPYDSVEWSHPCSMQCYSMMMNYMMMCSKAADFITAIPPSNNAITAMGDCLAAHEV